MTQNTSSSYDELKRRLQIAESALEAIRTGQADAVLGDEKTLLVSLAEAERRYRGIFDGSRDGFLMMDVQGRFLDANQAFCDMIGFPLEELMALPDVHCITPEQWRQWEREEIWNKRLLGEGDSGLYQKEYVRKDGTIFPVEVHSYAVRGQSGEVDYLWEIARDITERKRIEERLRASEEYQRALINASPVAIYSLDSDGRVQTWNAAAERIFGWTENDVLGRPLPIVPEGRREEFADLLRRVLAGESFQDMELARRCKDGTMIDVSLSAAPVYDQSGKVIAKMTLVADITEQKRAEAEHEKLEARMHQTQKMESVGRLAGGVAHDYNNMLSVILGYTEMALDQVDPDGPLHQDLEEVLSAARRSADITRQLLAFSRQQTVSPKVLDVNEAIEGMLKMLRRLIGEDINLLWKPGKELYPVKMDPTQLDQVLANLCINAKDAIAGVGKITIETGAAVFDETYSTDRAGFIPGEYTVLAVSDDGCGMDKKTLVHLFEPFFTTKERAEGTGLGLATVYGIVRQNRGHINVYSEPDEGTTFRIYLPRHAAGNEEEKPKPSPEALMGRNETILLVEDEPSILKIGKKILESSGYTVLAAGGPEEAAALAEEHTGEVHLLITDVVMPQMNGKDLADQLLARYPALKVLFMSGYTANAIAHRGVLDEGVCFVQKPFSKQALAEKVREALEG